MIFLAQADVLEAFARLEFWQVIAFLATCAVVYIILRQNNDNKITGVVMGNNRELTQQFVKAVETTDKLKDQLAAQGETIRKQNEQTEATTDAIKAAVATLVSIQKSQETLSDRFQAVLLHVEGTTEVLATLNNSVTGIKEDTEAIVVKTDNLSKHLEDDTATTQKLITESAERTIKATGERLTELDTVIRTLPENFCKDIKEALSSDLTAVQTTLNSIMAHLSAQKEASNETPFTPVVDLPVMPDGGKSGNGTGTDTDL